jgi:hypothetical protein
MNEFYRQEDEELAKADKKRLRQKKRRERKEYQKKMEEEIIEKATDVIRLAMDQQLNTNQPIRQPQPQFQYRQPTRPLEGSKGGRYRGVGGQTGCVACRRRLYDPL